MIFQDNFFKSLFLLLPLLLSSCMGTLTSTVIEPALENMQQQSDIELVCEGTPAYLLMVDSIIASDINDPSLLTLGAKAYGGYIGAMQECGLSQKRILAIADKARLYGTRLLGLFLPVSSEASAYELDIKLQQASKSDVPELFWGTFAWITWIEQQQGKPEAMADLVKIEKILLRIIALDETVQSGAAHFLLGAYYGSRPQMFGGKPELSKFHFDRALKLSDRNMLIVQTTYAKTLARLTMNKELHNSLLLEVINYDQHSSKTNMLANQIAKSRARKLLQENYFSDE